MNYDVNGHHPLSEDIEGLNSEEEAQRLGLWLPPDPGEESNIGEIEAQNWREYENIATNSLWIIGSRSRDGVHTGKYHGNFVPQIPYQAIRRFTKPGDVVLDLFLGSGTTLIECRRLGRHGIGVELVDSIANEAKTLIDAAANPHHTWQEVIKGDSTELQTINETRRILKDRQCNKVQLLVMHPPYHDIIKFSDNPGDLSNMPTVAAFLEAFKKVVYHTYDLLEQKHFLVVVIGDTYSAGEWIPLGFRTMEAIQSVGYTLKSVVVKNMEGNRAKRNLQNLWRQRAFRGDYYIFKHEYILFFQKKERIVAVLEEVAEFVRRIDAREELNLIQNSSFATGEVLNRYLSRNYTFISSPRILVLKQGAHIRAVVINLIGIELTQHVIDELQNFLGELPDSVVDVSILAESEKKVNLEKIKGLSQVYTSDEKSLEQLAHALYIVRKATGSGQRAGRAEAVAFASKLNEVLQKYFTSNKDYEWRQRGKGIGFKFFRRDPDCKFDDIVNEGLPNFVVGIETKWISGHEKEKAPQIRDNCHKKEFKLVAIVGHNIGKWESFIKDQGNFADYYLFLNREDEKSLEQIIKSRHLFRAYGSTNFKETEWSLIEFLKDQEGSYEIQSMRATK